MCPWNPQEFDSVRTWIIRLYGPYKVIIEPHNSSSYVYFMLLWRLNTYHLFVWLLYAIQEHIYVYYMGTLTRHSWIHYTDCCMIRLVLLLQSINTCSLNSHVTHILLRIAPCNLFRSLRSIYVYVIGEKLWRDRGSNPVPFADRANNLPLSYRATRSYHQQFSTWNLPRLHIQYLFTTKTEQSYAKKYNNSNTSLSNNFKYTPVREPVHSNT